MRNPFRIKNVLVSPDAPLVCILGPCVIEGEDETLFAADFLQKLTQKLSCQLIFKASYDKANRSSFSSFRGPRMEKGLKILERVRQELGVPVTSDVHTEEEALIAGEVLDLVQIPAFLSRQTDLLLAAAKGKAPVNVKKGQFLAPWDMKNVVEKLKSAGKEEIILTERGASFGYNNLVSDFRSIPIMQELGAFVCYDASHSVQLPGGLGHASGGERHFIPTLARCAIAAGADLLFLETHPDPANAKSDKATVYPFDQLEALLQELLAIRDIPRVVEKSGIWQGRSRKFSFGASGHCHEARCE